MVMYAQQSIDSDDAFEQLYDLLCAIAAGRPADRSEAVSYSSCRTAVMGSGDTGSLPGFVLQCMSVARFRDFITLYDPDPEVRRHFVRTEFDRLRVRRDMLGGFDAPRRAAMTSEWTL